MLRDIDEHATPFIEPNAAQAGAGPITLAVAGLDALLERLAAERIEHEPIETYPNGARHVSRPGGSSTPAAARPPATAARRRHTPSRSPPPPRGRRHALPALLLLPP